MTKFVLLINENKGTPKIWGGWETKNGEVQIFWGGMNGGLNTSIKTMNYLYDTRDKKRKEGYELAFDSNKAHLNPLSVFNAIKRVFRSTNGQTPTFQNADEREAVSNAFRVIGSNSLRSRAAQGDITNVSPSPNSTLSEPTRPKIELDIVPDETSDLFKALSGW